jgi:hypothetical protein
MTLDVYAHVFDEFDVADRISAEEQIRRARRALMCPFLCPSGPDQAAEDQETPANPYNPICLPRISFMRPEYGTGGQPPPRKDMNPLQLSLFESDGDDQS